MNAYVKLDEYCSPICLLEDIQFKFIKSKDDFTHHCYIDLSQLLQKYTIINQTNTWVEMKMFYHNKAGQICEYSAGHVNPQDNQLHLHGSLIITGKNWYDKCRWCCNEPDQICNLSRYRYHMLHHIK